jgi:hypothetical protein
MRLRVAVLITAALAWAAALPAFAQSYLAKSQVVGGNPGPAHNYVCPNVEAGGALDCYLDAVLHLYTMCRHVKSIEIIEHGYDRSGDGTNTAKSDSCIVKQKGNIARPFQTAMREVNASKQATEGLRSLHELWLGALASLKWQPGESDEDYKVRTGFVYAEFAERSDAIRESVIVMRASAAAKPVVRQAAREKASR